jgi:NAD-dependent SIR2 family protein deacetylase
MAATEPTPEDYDKIARELKAGDVVPFLGAGASVSCGLPSGSMLAERLATAGKFPDQQGYNDLARVASWLAMKEGSPRLKRELREAIAVDCKTGSLHEFLASNERLRLVITTNYDDLIERALEERWIAEGRKAGRHPWIVVDRGDRQAVWVRQSGQPWKRDRADRLEKTIRDDQQPIVFKMHGSLNRERKDDDEYLITEEQYIDFLGRGDKVPIPPMIEQMMLGRHLLFLGYGLHDWNVRVLLLKLSKTRLPGSKVNIWAIMRKPEKKEEEPARDAECALWRDQGVTIFEVDLADFVSELRARL